MHGVKPLPGRTPPRSSPPARRPAPPSPKPPPAAPPPSAPPLTVDRAPGYDRANAERLKRGRQPVEARLDLHGLTQAEAHRALAAFLRAARADGKRCVLVITGRGSGRELPGGGVLKSAVPRWLDEPDFRPHVLAIATAQPRDGGSGALYVMLRRTRSA
jgi:DNA-nicking Smr family endonuclease